MFEFDPKTSFVLITALLNFVLGAFVLFKNSKEEVNQTFGVMTFLVGLWSLVAFLFRAWVFNETAYMFGFFLYDVAALLPISFLVMALAFPPYSLMNKRLSGLLLLYTVAIIFLINLPQAVIEGMTKVGGEKILIWGKYYLVYVLHQILFFFIGYLILLKKFFKAKGIEKQQVKYIIFGTFIPANLALVTNLILPWFNIYEYYTWAGQLFMILLVLFSGYSILKHRLFDIRIIATELFIIGTSATLFARFMFAENSFDKALGAVVFAAVTIFGILLINSVWKEVDQREKLQTLSYKLQTVNEQLASLDKARAEFISIASHQLRTPPATIKWYLAAILSGDFGKINPKVKEALERSQLTNNGLISLIDDMLNTSRIERGKMEFLYESTDVEKLVENAVLQLQPQASIKKLKLEYIKPKVKIPMIAADKEKLSQVFNNLIDNAIKYSKTGKITVFLEKNKTHLLFKVTDHGKGVSKEDMEGIFAKYGRGKDSQRHASGLGLGLYVAKIVVEHHNGIIWAESKGLGEGSTFFCKLPIKSQLTNDELDLAKTA